MALTMLHDLAKELDKYIRKAYVQHLTDYPPEFTAFTKTDEWPKNGGLLAPFIREAQFPTIGPAVVKAEAQPIIPQALRDGRTKDVYSVRFGTAVAFTHEKMHVGHSVYNSAKKPAMFLADAQRLTYESYYGDFFVYATDAGAPPELLGFDGQPLLSQTHGLMNGGTASNLRATAGSVTYTVLNDVLTAVARSVTEEGTPDVTQRVTELWVPPEEELNALEVLQSVGRPDTANRADNVVKQRLNARLSKDSVKVLTWMPATHWYAVNGPAHSLTAYTLQAPSVTGPIRDEYRDTYAWKITFWIARAFWDWRGIYGVPRP